MSTHRKIDRICIVSAVMAVVLTALLMGGKVYGMIPAASAGTEGGLFTANDLNADWDTASATKILLSDEGSRISGNGAYVYEGDVYIVYAGQYVLTGELTNGSVIIDADKSDKIWISLDGVKIHCEDDAAIRVEQAQKVFLTLAGGTENMLSSGAEYSKEVTASGVDGVIYSRDDLTINGTGALAVDAAYQHGIVCNDDLVVAGGSLTINAVQDGIHANDSVCIREASISISAGDDGITVSNDDETSFLYVESGNITIPACYEGLEAIEITIVGGTIEIMPTDDGINAAGSGEHSFIRIAGGDIRIVNSLGRDADGLDSNGSIYIEGGRVFISVLGSGSNCALDYGSENGGECVVNGGTVIACGGGMMAEGFDAGSAQGFLMYSAAGQAGAIVRLEDSQGRELLSEEIPCGFTSVVLSVPELKVGDVCTIEVGDIREQITIDNSSSSGFGFGSSGMFGGGMQGGRGHDGRFAEMPEGMLSEMPEGMPGKQQEGMQEEMPEGMPGKQQEEMPEGMSGEMQEGMPGKQQEEMPEGMPGEMQEGMPGKQPEEMPEGMPGEMQEGMPGKQPEEMPEGMPGERQDSMPGDREHGDVPERQQPEEMTAVAGRGVSGGEGRFGRQDIWETSGGVSVSEMAEMRVKLGLLGISMVSLLLGLAAAVIIKQK